MKMKRMARLVTEDWLRDLRSDKAADRWQAAAHLIDAARSRHAVALAALGNALDDDHPFVRWRAGLALAQAGRTQAIALLLDGLKHGTPRRRAAAADALATTRQVDVDPLLDALASKEALVRQSAAEALGRLGHRRDAARFVALLTDESPWVRRAAARTLGHIGDDTAIAHLSQRLSDESPLVRRSAAYALGAMRARLAVSALVAALSDPDAQVRRNAAWGLGRIGDRAALPKLRLVRNDTALDGDVANEAQAAIRAIERPKWQQLPGMARNWLARRKAAA
jgi:HEAT repeat protein